MKTVHLMKTIPVATGILGMLAAVFLATPANAASLATTQVTCVAGGTISFGPASQDFTCNKGSTVNSGIYNYAENTYAATSVGALSALAQGSVTGGEDNSFSPRYVLGSSIATVTYGFNVVAPTGYDPNLAVPLLVDVYLQTTITGGDSENQSTADAYVSLLDNSNSHTAIEYACVHGGYPGDCSQANFSGSFVDNVTPNSLITAKINAAIQLRNGQTGIAPAQAQAFADPYIQIDPAFLAAHPGYSLTFGANVTNAPPVPAPAAGWLFGSGLMGLVGVARRKKAA